MIKNSSAIKEEKMFSKIRKSGIVIACVFLLLTIVCASSLPGKSATKELHFVIMAKGIHPWWEPGGKGFEAAAEKFGGITVEYLAPPEFSIEAQTKMIESVIARGVDGMAIAAYSAKGMEPVINEAVRMGIPVVTWDSDAPESKRTCYIGTENKEAGKIEGEVFAKLMNYKGKYVIGAPDLTGFSILQRIEGIRSVIKRYPKMVEVREPLLSGQMMDKGLENAENLFTAYPDLDGIVDVTVEAGVGGSRVLEEKGEKPGEMKIIVWTDFPDVLDCIRKGYTAVSLRQNPYAMGYLSLIALRNIKMGKKPKFVQYDTGVVLLTKDNLDTYKKEEIAAAKAMADEFDNLWE